MHGTGWRCLASVPTACLVVFLCLLPCTIQAKRRDLLSFGADTYKKSVIVKNKCSIDGSIYFISSNTYGDYDDCPEAFEFLEYEDLCTRSIPAGTEERITIERYGKLTFFENNLDEYFAGEYDTLENYRYSASICIEGSIVSGPEAAPPEDDAPSDDEEYDIDPGLAEVGNGTRPMSLVTHSWIASCISAMVLLLV